MRVQVEMLIEDSSVGSTKMGRIWGVMSNGRMLSFRNG